MKFPDNLKCVLYNDNHYFTHYYDGWVNNFSKEIHLYFLYASKQDIKNNNAYRNTNRFDKYPTSDIIELVKENYNRNQSYINHDFSKDTFVEMPFISLPVEVQNIFRCFEKHDDFKISEGVAFNLDTNY